MAQTQLYIVFVVADGGADLERYELRSFEEAKGLLLQATVTLAVGEAAAGFEHRDLHWGNVLLRPTLTEEVTMRLRCEIHRPMYMVAATITGDNNNNNYNYCSYSQQPHVPLGVYIFVFCYHELKYHRWWNQSQRRGCACADRGRACDVDRLYVVSTGAGGRGCGVLRLAGRPRNF